MLSSRVILAHDPRQFASPSPPDLCVLSVLALDCSFSFVVSNFQLSTFNFHTFPPPPFFSPLITAHGPLPTLALSPLAATLTKTRGHILQAKYPPLPSCLPTLQRSCVQTCPFPFSVYSSKFRIPQVLYLPLLRKHHFGSSRSAGWPFSVRITSPAFSGTSTRARVSQVAPL